MKDFFDCIVMKGYKRLDGEETVCLRYWTRVILKALEQGLIDKVECIAYLEAHKEVWLFHPCCIKEINITIASI